MPTHKVWKTALLLAVSLARGQDLPAACQKYKSVRIPSGDQPSPQQAKTLAKCSSVNLYYGLGGPADPDKARLCAYVEIAGKQTHDEYFWGPAILAMVYANGQGSARNFDLALRFACEADALGSADARIQHLEEFKAKNWKGSDFDVCDDISRSVMEHGLGVDGACGDKDDKIRVAKLDAIIAKWSVPDRQAFAKLQKAADAFFDARSDAETDQSGAGRAIIPAAERAALDDSFIAALARFEGGTTPNFTSADFAKADAELNAAYQKALKAAGPGKGTVTAAGIRQTERVWLAYLTAWVTFAKQKYPNVTADSWRVWLTVERTKQLRDLIQVP
jgi:uncharacterized protein YecT (DUF1311 family)